MRQAVLPGATTNALHSATTGGKSEIHLGLSAIGYRIKIPENARYRMFKVVLDHLAANGLIDRVPNCLEPSCLAANQNLKIGFRAAGCWKLLNIQPMSMDLGDIGPELAQLLRFMDGIFVVLVIFGLIERWPEAVRKQPYFEKVDRFISGGPT